MLVGWHEVKHFKVDQIALFLHLTSLGGTGLEDGSMATGTSGSEASKADISDKASRSTSRPSRDEA